MKRSEMIKLLQQEIQVDDNVSLRLWEVEANVILTYIEKLGMLPPLLHESLDDDFGQEIHGNIYGWEPENE